MQRLIVEVPIGTSFRCPTNDCSRTPGGSQRFFNTYEKLKKHANTYHAPCGFELLCRECHLLFADRKKSSGHLRSLHRLGPVDEDVVVTPCAWSLEALIGRPARSTSPSTPRRSAATGSTPARRATHRTPVLHGLPPASQQALSSAPSPPRRSTAAASPSRAPARQATSSTAVPSGLPLAPQQALSPSACQTRAAAEAVGARAPVKMASAGAAPLDAPAVATTTSAGHEPRQVLSDVLLPEHFPSSSSSAGSWFPPGRDPCSTPARLPDDMRALLQTNINNLLSTARATTPRRSPPRPLAATSIAARLRRAHLGARTPPALRRTPVSRTPLLPSPPPIFAAPRPSSSPPGDSTGARVAVAEATPQRVPALASALAAAPDGVSMATIHSTCAAPRQVLSDHDSLNSPSGSDTDAASPPGSPASPHAAKLSRLQRDWLPKIRDAGSWEDFETVVEAFTAAIRPPERRKRGSARARSRGQQTGVQAAKHLQQLYSKDRKRAMREIREEESPLCPVEPAKVATFFKNVFSEQLCTMKDPPADVVLPPAQEVDEELLAPFSAEDIFSRIGRSPNTAPGPDGIQYRLLKTKDPGAHIIAAIYNRCLKDMRIPVSWKAARTILLHKKGPKEDLSNWRPISLSSVLYKVYSGLLATRLGKWASRTGAVSSVQKGFMPAEGCLEHNYLLQEALTKSKESGSQLVVSWLDLRNAFGSVPHAAIFHVLRLHGLPPGLLDIIQDLYEGCTTTITTATGETDAVDMRAGVKQGDPLSPIVFNLVIEVIIRSILAQSDLHGFPLHDHRISCLAYADDLVLMSQSLEGAQKLLDAAGASAEWLGLRFNATKCATLHVFRKKAKQSTTTVQGDDIPCLKEDEAYHHLGVPTGLSIQQTPDETIAAMRDDVTRISASLLKPWQKLDAIRTFVLPQIQFSLLTARVKKAPLILLDAIIKSTCKEVLHLPRRASPELVFLPMHRGGANILPLSDMADVGTVVHAFKLLTCPDAMVRSIATAAAKATASRVIGHDATDEELAAFLSGDDQGTHAHPAASVWTTARSASRRLAKKVGQLRWSWCPTLQLLSVDVHFPGKEPETTRIEATSRHLLHSKLRLSVQHYYHLQLLAKKDQGRVYEATSRCPSSNHFMAFGQFTRFCDWRFVHRARLNVLPLNGALRGIDRPKTCRRCQYPNETLAHVLCHCHRHSRAWQNRHRSVIKNVLNALPADTKANLRVEKTIPGLQSRLMPDLVTLDENTKTAAILDVACPFENGYGALAAKRQHKILKYQHLAVGLRDQGYQVVHLNAIVVGCLGAWDPANEESLSILGIPSKKRLALKKKIVSDVVRWSRDIYVEHVNGKRQYTSDEVIPCL